MRFNLGLLFLINCIVHLACTRISDKTKIPKPELISEALQVEIDYGRKLIERTAYYLGPKGKVAKLIPGRTNCQNCHLNAGTKPFGISFETVHARYPDYRAREGKVLTLADRINNCMERPMNGKPLSHTSREMRALLSYFRWLSRGIPVGSRMHGDRLNEVIKFPDRAADSKKGKLVFQTKCISCHGEQGEGKLNENGIEYIYPPLWGNESFSAGSNMHRVIKLAAFVKANMPLGATYNKPLLSDDEAFDVSAFINDEKEHSRPPSRWNDYKNISEKPIDFPIGPYADKWTEAQHRRGPYLPIIKDLQSRGNAAWY